LIVRWPTGNARDLTTPVKKGEEQEKPLNVDEMCLKGLSKSYGCAEKVQINVIKHEAFVSQNRSVIWEMIGFV
jgi:hypothetical protein